MRLQKDSDRPVEMRAYHSAVLTALLWFTCTVVLFFAAVHIYVGENWLAASELCLVAYAAMLLYAPHDTIRVRMGNLIFAVPFFVVMMYGLATIDDDMSAFVWVLLVPILSHLLLGRWQGMLIALIFMICAGVIFIYRYEPEFGLPGFMAVANLSLCAAAIFAFSHVYEVSRERTESELRRLALVDSLTGLANRSHFRDVFSQERERFLRHKTPLSLLVVDIDHFKRVNDNFGHDAGDIALCFVADILRNRIRQTDVAGRLGGEEFGVLLSGADVDYAVKVAGMLRERIAQRPVRYHGQTIVLSVSIGVAELGRDGMEFRTLFAKADERLYQAKAQGRNRVVS